MKAEHHVMSNGLGRPATLAAKRFNQRRGVVPLASDHVLMVVEVGERRVNGCKREMRMCVNSFVGRHPHMLDLACDLADFHVGSGNDCSAAEIINVRSTYSLDDIDHHAMLLAGAVDPEDALLSRSRAE